MSDELDEFEAFIQEDKAELSAAGPMALGDADFESYVSGEVLDLEFQAKRLKAEKDARDYQEFYDLAKEQAVARGYDPDTKTWRKPDPVPDDSTAPMPALATDDTGAPLVSPERWAQWADTESLVGQMSEDQFSRLCAARDAGKSLPYGEAPLDAIGVDQAYLKLLGKL